MHTRSQRLSMKKGMQNISLILFMMKISWESASLVAQTEKNLPAMQENWVLSLCWEDPLENGTATHSSLLAWRIPWTEDCGRLQSMGSQRVRHGWATFTPALQSDSLPSEPPRKSYIISYVYLVAQVAKNLPAMQETQVRSLGQEDPLEKGMATHSTLLAWRIPWTEEPGRLQSMGSQRVGHN